MDYYVGVLKKYAIFDGRAQRKEYWMFQLINFLIGLMFLFLEYGIKNNAITNPLTLINFVYVLVILIPNWAVTVRRLHDTNHSAWWLLINLIPIIGWIYIFILTLLDGTLGDNKYGPNPKGITVK